MGKIYHFRCKITTHDDSGVCTELHHTTHPTNTTPPKPHPNTQTQHQPKTICRNKPTHTPLHRMFTKVNNTIPPPTIPHTLSTVLRFCRVDGVVRFAHPTTHGNGLLESQHPKCGESVRRKRPIFPHNNTTQVFFPLQFCPCDRWKLRFHRRLGTAVAVPTGWELRSQP